MTVEALPILAYKVAPAQFDLAWDQAFISIRDQAVRVRTLLQALKDEGQFNPHLDVPRDVLVVGAGYAGATAAMWLVSNGIPATLVELGIPFGVQSGCDSRHLSLTQYDWPARHHAVHDYPAGMAPDYVGYPWPGAKTQDHLTTSSCQPACDQAAEWTKQLDAFAKANTKLLSYSPPTRLVLPVKAVNGAVQAQIQSVTTGYITTRFFRCVLYAAGFGSDQSKVRKLTGGGDHQTKGFWDHDDLATPGTSPPGRILISGGGDGAMQDFLRAVLDPKLCPTAGDAAAQIVQAVKNAGPAVVDEFATAWAVCENHVADAELQAAHAHTWVGEPADAIWAELHAAHIRAARQLAKNVPNELAHALEYITQRSEPISEVTLVHPGATPGKIYALNRFLYVLLHEFYTNAVVHSTFFGQPVSLYGKAGTFPTVRMLANHSLDMQKSSYHPVTRVYDAVVAPPNNGALRSFTVDELLIRHGMSGRPPRLSIRQGVTEIGFELGRIRLPYLAVK